jgi:hypothetical protein
MLSLITFERIDSLNGARFSFDCLYYLKGEKFYYTQLLINTVLLL